MRFLEKAKDGGRESTVDAYFLIEIKGLLSVALLRFSKGSRQNFHSHAFNALTWFLKGSMVEHRKHGAVEVAKKYKRTLLPKVTKRDNLHKVVANEVSWCLTLRGRWQDTWQEQTPVGEVINLTHGRKIVKSSKE